MSDRFYREKLPPLPTDAELEKLVARAIYESSFVKIPWTTAHNDNKRTCLVGARAAIAALREAGVMT